MADLYGTDPARIKRLRSPERLGYFDPAKIWDALDPDPSVTPVNIGSGVGSLPCRSRGVTRRPRRSVVISWKEWSRS